MVEDGPVLCRFILRGRPAEGFGLALPRAPREVAVAGDRAALWLGPDEWLLLAAPSDAAAIAVGLAGADSLVEVSDAFVALRVAGPQSARLLSAGCPLDLHPTAFPAGTATRTLLGKAGITLWRQGAEAWHLEVPRSLAAYARAFLAEAARGMPEA
jgi:heterotetrameric sarcosine oxidase gamma subunit